MCVYFLPGTRPALNETSTSTSTRQQQLISQSAIQFDYANCTLLCAGFALSVLVQSCGRLQYTNASLASLALFY